MDGLELYIYDDELWCKTRDGRNYVVDETCTEVVSYILNKVRAQYPDAYKALEECYRRCAPNVSYYQYKMARRFCRCNFGELDSTSTDIVRSDNGSTFNFEKVKCPLRGECPLEGRVCCPRFDSRLTKAEERVMRLLYDGKSKEEIGDELFVSPGTVKNQIKSAYQKIGVHSEAEFIKYVNENNLFTN